MLNGIHKTMLAGLGLFVALSINPITANAKDLILEKPVDKDKTWTVKFNNQVILNDSTKKEISIKDSKGTSVNVKVTLSEDGKAIYVSTGEVPYNQGETYKLLIGTNIYDKNNNKLKETSSITFKIKEEAKPESQYIDMSIDNIIKGHFREAIENTTKAIELNVNDVDAYIYRAYSYSRISENLEQGLSDINKALEIDSNNLAAYIVKGHIYTRLYKFDEAKTNINKGIALNPKNAAEYSIRGSGYIFLREYDKSAVDFNKIIEINPEATDAYTSIGYLYEVEENFDASLVNYNKVIRMDPSLGEAYEYRGTLYRNLGEYEKALSDINKSLELGTTKDTAYYTRGLIYTDLREYSNAVKDFTLSIEHGNLNASVYFYRAIAYGPLLEFNKASSDYTKAISLKPNNAEYYSGRGTMYFYLGKYEEAIKDFEVSTSVYDSFYDNMYCGLSHAELRQYDEAINSFSKAIEIGAKDDGVSLVDLSDALTKRGQAYMILKDYASALSDFYYALEYNPNNQDAQEYYDVLNGN